MLLSSTIPVSSNNVLSLEYKNDFLLPIPIPAREEEEEEEYCRRCCFVVVGVDVDDQALTRTTSIEKVINVKIKTKNQETKNTAMVGCRVVLLAIGFTSFLTRPDTSSRLSLFNVQLRGWK